MTRLLTIVAAVLVVLGIAGGLLWYLAYGMDLRPPDRVVLDSLETSTEIGWNENGFTTISAANKHDRYTALGYVHGRSRPWPMVLWRQAALGRLGQWFGPSALEIDSLSRKLGLAALAHTSYDHLSADQKALLRAYTSGLNAALQRPSSQLDQELTLLDIKPAPWKPWHTLALERLFAWLSTNRPTANSLQQAGPQVRAFFQADRRLRRLLHVYGFRRSTAWVRRDSAGTRLHRRLVYGTSALPVFEEVAFQHSDSTYQMGATVPGMPFFWAGQTSDRAWTLLPKSPLKLERGSWPDSSVQSSYERVSTANNKEYLLRIRRQPGFLPLGRARSFSSPSSLPPDTSKADSSRTVQGRHGWVLRWPGLQTGTDLAAWETGLGANGGSFHLQRGDGLLLQKNGDWRVTGSPEKRSSFSKGLVVGQTSWTPPLAAALDTLAHRAERSKHRSTRRKSRVSVPTPAPRIIEKCYSAWAAKQAPNLVAALDSVHRKPANRVQSALSYLRNWDYAYSSSSIAASIFDTWAAAYRDSTGHLPGALFAPDTARAPRADTSAAPPQRSASTLGATTTSDTTSPSPPDTLAAAYRAYVHQYNIFTGVIDSLRTKYGDELRNWRWERVSPDRRFFPAWSSDSLRGKLSSLMKRTRYAPLKLSGRGHPSSPCWGVSPIERGLPTPSAWVGVTSTDDWRSLRVRKRTHTLSHFMDRYLISDRPPPPTTLRPFLPPEHTTTLVPSSQPRRPSS